MGGWGVGGGGAETHHAFQASSSGLALGVWNEQKEYQVIESIVQNAVCCHRLSEEFQSTLRAVGIIDSQGVLQSILRRAVIDSYSRYTARRGRTGPE